MLTRSKTRKATRRGASARVPRRPGAVEDPGMYGRSLCGNREISSLTTGKTATADDSSLSPPRPNISRLDQVAELQSTVTAIRLVSTRGCLGISISSTPSA